MKAHRYDQKVWVFEFSKPKIFTSIEYSVWFASILRNTRCFEACALANNIVILSQRKYFGRLMQHWNLYILVYIDLQTSFPARSGYFIKFIDGYSRMTWVYFTKQKLTSSQYSKNFKALLKQSLHYLKTL